jgi:hypothetical protein
VEEKGMTGRAERRVVLAVFYAAIAIGATACTLGPAYEEASGSNVATVRALAQGEDAASPRKESTVRILQVDGRRVARILPGELAVAGGIRQIGVEASTGGGTVYQCITFFVKGGQKYLIRIAGPERDWAISITGEGIAEGIVPAKVVRAKSSCVPSPIK